jgi:hypothetical protein
VKVDHEKIPEMYDQIEQLAKIAMRESENLEKGCKLNMTI